jgi:hypothetical protein
MLNGNHYRVINHVASSMRSGSAGRGRPSGPALLSVHVFPRCPGGKGGAGVSRAGRWRAGGSAR